MDSTQQDKRSLLRFGTAGSVDSGKSTLIGQLLMQTRSIHHDQYMAIARTSQRKGLPEPDLALLTDGLKAEREQGITIDVAYRYFSTPRRKFIIADSPGHEQYTRNMVTGASNCDLMIVLLEADKGILIQSKRHSFIASLLRVPHLVVAVNKMDRLEYSQQVYDQIVEEFREFLSRLPIQDVTFIPIAALTGDNLTSRSPNMPWYNRPSLLEHLEEVHIAGDRNLIDLRFPVQLVIRPNGDFRGYAGTVASGIMRPGDEVVALPGGQASKVREVVGFAGPLEYACSGMSVTVTLEDNIDVGRGDMLVRPNNLPEVSNDLEAVVCWMDNQPLEVGKKYHIKHTSRLGRCMVTKLRHRIDVNTLHRQEADTLNINDIGRLRIKTLVPLALDPYQANRATGSFVLIDSHTCNTVAAGMIIGPEKTLDMDKIRHMQAEAQEGFAGGPQA